MKSKFTKHFLIFFFSLSLPLSLSSQSSASKECNEIIIQDKVTPAYQGMNNGKSDSKIIQRIVQHGTQCADGSVKKAIKNLEKEQYSVSVTNVECKGIGQLIVPDIESTLATVNVKHTSIKSIQK